MNIDYSGLSDTIEIELQYSTGHLETVDLTDHVQAVVDGESVVTLIVKKPRKNAQLFMNLITTIRKADQLFEPNFLLDAVRDIVAEASRDIYIVAIELLEPCRLRVEYSDGIKRVADLNMWHRLSNNWPKDPVIEAAVWGTGHITSNGGFVGWTLPNGKQTEIFIRELREA